MMSGRSVAALALIAGAAGSACQGLHRIGVPAEVPAEHLAFRARPRVPSAAEDLEFLNACLRQKRSTDMKFTDSGVALRWEYTWFSQTETMRSSHTESSTFHMPWKSVIQVVPQAACSVRGNCDSPAFWELGRLIKLTAWLPGRNSNTRQDEWRLATLAMLVEGCAPAEVLVALGHFVGPDRIVGCGQNCRAALAGQNP